MFEKKIIFFSRDEISTEQRASIISVIESLLLEGEDAIIESLLSGEDASACLRKK